MGKGVTLVFQMTYTLVKLTSLGERGSKEITLVFQVTYNLIVNKPNASGVPRPPW